MVESLKLFQFCKRKLVIILVLFIGVYAFGTLVISAPYGRKLFKNLIQKLIALRAEIIWAKPLRDFLFLGSLFEREINENYFQNYSKIYQINQKNP